MAISWTLVMPLLAASEAASSWSSWTSWSSSCAPYQLWRAQLASRRSTPVGTPSASRSNPGRSPMSDASIAGRFARTDVPVGPHDDDRRRRHLVQLVHRREVGAVPRGLVEPVDEQGPVTIADGVPERGEQLPRRAHRVDRGPGFVDARPGEMDVGVDEPRHDRRAGELDDPVGGGRLADADAFDVALVDQGPTPPWRGGSWCGPVRPGTASAWRAILLGVAGAPAPRRSEADSAGRGAGPPVDPHPSLLGVHQVQVPVEPLGEVSPDVGADEWRLRDGLPHERLPVVEVLEQPPGRAVVAVLVDQSRRGDPTNAANPCGRATRLPARDRLDVPGIGGGGHHDQAHLGLGVDTVCLVVEDHLGEVVLALRPQAQAGPVVEQGARDLFGERLVTGSIS